MMAAGTAPGTKAAIAGRGIIGSSWAVVFARAGLDVAIWDHSGAGPARTLAPAHAILAGLAGTSLAGPHGTAGRITAHADLAAVLDGATYVQESAPERLDIKQALYREIEARCAPGTVIGTSTSGLLPSALSAGMRHPGRFLVAHPLTPPHLLPVVELVPSPETAPEVTAWTASFMRSLGQRPFVVQAEIEGFVLNRILAAVLNEIFLLIGEGVLRPDDADLAMTAGFGLRWACIGPMAAMDLNAPGGIGDYLHRYGGLFAAITAGRGTQAGLDPAVIAQLATAMRGHHKLEAAPARQAARDQAIARVRDVLAR